MLVVRKGDSYLCLIFFNPLIPEMNTFFDDYKCKLQFNSYKYKMNNNPDFQDKWQVLFYGR